jgi:hypothetical protein
VLPGTKLRACLASRLHARLGGRWQERLDSLPKIPQHGRGRLIAGPFGSL